MKKFKIYFENRVITLSQEPDRVQKYSLFYKYNDDPGLNDEIQKFRHDLSIHSLNIYCRNIDHLWLRFANCFTIAEAAGGLVRHPSNSYLFIKRYGKWDLPKGHMEQGETYEECARREIEEECGISGLKMIKSLPNSFHTYVFNDVNYLKITHWFLFDYRGAMVVFPNAEEGITDGEWMPPEAMPDIRDNTWTSLLDLLNETIRIA